MSLDQRLADAARHVAEQVDPPEVDLDAVRSQAHANRRRTVALAVAAAVVAVGLAAIPLLATGRGTAAPQPAVSPTSDIIRNAARHELRRGPMPQAQRLRNPAGSELLTASAAREAGGPERRLGRPMGRAPDLTGQRRGRRGPDRVPAGRVRGPRAVRAGDGASTGVAPDATMDDVVRLLTTLPQFAVLEGPRALPAFGRDTRYLKVRADRVTCPAVRDARYQLADIYWGDGFDSGGESAIEPGRPVLIEFWVLELEGKPVVVEARQEGRPETAMVDQLDQVRESLTFGIRQ